MVTALRHTPAHTTVVAVWQWQLCGFMHFALTAITTMAAIAGQDIIQTQYQQAQTLAATVTRQALLEVDLVEVDTLWEAKNLELGLSNYILAIGNR